MESEKVVPEELLTQEKPEKPGSKRARRYTKFILTINNYPENWKELFRLDSFVAYAIGCPEVAPTTGTPHIQGYIRYEVGHARSLDSVKKRYRFAAPANGNDLQNRNYCHKIGQYAGKDGVFGPNPDAFELGALSHQGARKDLSAVQQAVFSGQTMAEMTYGINGSTPPIRNQNHLKFAESLIKIHAQVRDSTIDPRVEWWYGPSATGKSRAAFAEFPDAYVAMENSKWWDGYESQSTVIIDDFSSDWCSFRTLLKILDRYPYRIEVKGSSTQLVATTFIITSEKPPEAQYPNIDCDKVQLYRRITNVRKYSATKDYKNFKWSPEFNQFMEECSEENVPRRRLLRP